MLQRLKPILIFIIGFLILISADAYAVDLITNGTFDSNINDWNAQVLISNGTRTWDNSVYGLASGSIRYITNTGRRLEYELNDSIYIPTVINSTDQVNLSFYWRKYSDLAISNLNILTFYIVRPDGTSSEVWTETSKPATGQTLDGNVTNLDISSFCTQTGNYYLRVYVDIRSGGNNSASTQVNLDDIVLDVPVTNNAPTVIAGNTSISPVTVNRLGANTTTLSTTFSDADQPGVSAFNVTFKVREPNDVTESVLVNAQPNGSGGLTIVDNGGGSYTATYTWDPDAVQTLGDYDLYFEVTDGADNVIDDFSNNLNELNVYQQTAPTITSGATSVSPPTVNRTGSNATTISTTFTDSDQPGVGTFTINFKVREPDNATEVALVTNQTSGNGGLTITDNGGGSYTASYTWDPGAAQTLGLYDLYFDVSDGIDNATDDYTGNLNELSIIEANDPTIVAGATTFSPASINIVGTVTTTISTTFNDIDQPGVGAFNVTFKIREPNDVTEVALVSNQLNGSGGLTITDNGSGSYTASYTWDPGAGQTLGDYDLYCEVSDGSGSASDDYTNNLNELNLYQQNAPTVVAGATTSSSSQVNRFGNDNVTISAIFTDIDEPNINDFFITLKIREPNDITEVILLDNLQHGQSGLTITNNGGGDYTATYSYNPDDNQTIGLYDIYFAVSDGTDMAVDDYSNNTNEIELFQQISPTVALGATQVSPITVNRLGTNTTTISAVFQDGDRPAVTTLFVTFKIRKPDNSTEVVLVNNLTDGQGGLTIVNNSGAQYTASYTYNPDDAIELGAYDLYFELFDGTDFAIDDYPANLDELTIYQETAPTIASSATQASPATINRLGANTTTISADFTDADQPGVGAFSVTMKVREPNNSTEITLVNTLGNGVGGLTITDNGGGSYTANYDWDPGLAQTLGLYDLYFEVSDGTYNTIDDYTANLDELTLIEANDPTVVASATSISPASINRLGVNSTTFTTDFNDVDQPGVGAFNVTFKVREPNNSTELTVANALANGAGGMVITDNGGGSYTASYTWDPGDAQTVGNYDLFFEVSDGSGFAIDNYLDNLDELNIYQQTAPSVVAGVTSVSPEQVNRSNNNSTTISADFYDVDQPGVEAFIVTFKVREPNNATEAMLVDAQTNGNGGLSITDNGSGSYTASYNWNPDVTQTIGLYDLYFEVSDGTDNVVDAFAANLDELEIIQSNIPTLVTGATSVSVATVNRYSNNTSVITTDFIDADQPAVGSFAITFKIREPNNSTELDLVNGLTHGNGGLIVTDNGSGSYTASYNYNPDDAQTLGLYDLYFNVNDGSGSATDDYANNLDELTIIENLPDLSPVISAGATAVTVNPINRVDNNTTVIYADFYDQNLHAVSAFTVTVKIREPNDVTELVLVNNQGNGAGGVTITDLGGGNYRAEYIYDPDVGQTLGFYDLYLSVDDNTGTTAAVDDYSNNLNQLNIIESLMNNAPTIVAGAAVASPSSVSRFNTNTTILSSDFTDTDQPEVGTFTTTFKLRPPYGGYEVTIADNLTHGTGGMTITDNGGGSYTASINYDPAVDAELGYYDIYFAVSDGIESAVDDYDNNLDGLLITSIGENSPPVIQSDATFASPAAVERIGTNPVTINTDFSDADAPAVSAYLVKFALRKPDNSTEIILADNIAHGSGGLTVTDQGGGVYTASINWEPPDAQDTGFYDLYCHVIEGTDTSFDDYHNNLAELHIYDAISNNPPTTVAGNTFALPVAITRIGSEFTMIKGAFTDIDMPGRNAFTISLQVRDQASALTSIVTLAKNGEQGLRITDVGGGLYETSVLWDPSESQVLGTYDLYMYIEDNHSASVTDDFIDNQDELTITNDAILGDGNLLHRTNTATSCGGANSACHNIAGHQLHDCLDCHTPHGNANIYLVKDTITTPNSGDKEVIFKTLGIGDPYNDPDPTPGDANSGVMADATDGVYTGVCEVCHTTAGHHRNDGSQPPAVHQNAKDCTPCHPHSDGFAVSGGGESSGGMACVCHSAIYNSMDSTSVLYRHILADNEAVYSPGASGMYTIKNCLTCHVDHDIFRVDINTGIGQRGKNLRTDWSIDPILGSSTVLSNSDYTSSDNGGICLSCHGGSHPSGACSGCHSAHKAPGSFHEPLSAEMDAPHTYIPKIDYDAATLTHNYDVPITFSSDGSIFNANCIKCHNDDRTQSYQSSTTTFSFHSSNYSKLLDADGIAVPVDPLEENFCFRCHSTTSNPNAGSNLDYFGVKSMANQSALNIETAFSRTYAHPTQDFSGRHSINDSSLTLGDGNRHAECSDCHNVHASLQGTHDGSSNLVSGSLKGAWGVEPTSWPAAATPTDNGNVFTAPAGYTRLNPATKEYQICLKCHSNYTTLPSGSRNLAEEINPNYPSSHGIVQAGDNDFCNSTTMFEPWGTSGINYCSDCHRSSISTDPEGPHGSNIEHMLVATVVSDVTNGTPLCYNCHRSTVYWSGSSASSRFPSHPAAKSGHKYAHGCFACHMWDYASTAGLGVPTTTWSGGTPPAGLFVHGQNKKWVYRDRDGSAGTQQPVDAFINGYMSDMDYTNRQCWSEVCRTHSGISY